MKALGDYCGGVPPLPIPNREVKTASADGTAHCCGRVGRRHSLIKLHSFIGMEFFFISTDSGCHAEFVSASPEFI